MPQRCCTSTLALVVLLLWMAGHPARAEQITLRTAPYISEALTKAIADNAEPTTQLIPAGEKLDRYVRDKCGARRQEDEEYWALLKDANPNLDVTTKLPVAEPVTLPRAPIGARAHFRSR